MKLYYTVSAHCFTPVLGKSLVNLKGSAVLKTALQLTVSGPLRAVSDPSVCSHSFTAWQKMILFSSTTGLAHPWTRETKGPQPQLVRTSASHAVGLSHLCSTPSLCIFCIRFFGMKVRADMTHRLSASLTKKEAHGYLTSSLSVLSFFTPEEELADSI